MIPAPGDVVLIGPRATGDPRFREVTVRVIRVDAEEPAPAGRVWVTGSVLDRAGAVLGTLAVPVLLTEPWPSHAVA